MRLNVTCQPCLSYFVGSLLCDTQTSDCGYFVVWIFSSLKATNHAINRVFLLNSKELYSLSVLVFLAYFMHWLGYYDICTMNQMIIYVQVK